MTKGPRPRHSRETIAEMYGSGMSIREAAATLGVCRNTVRNALRILQVPNRIQKNGRPRKNPLGVIAELYALGETQVSIGKLLDIHHTTVGYALDQLNIPRNQRRHPKAPREHVERVVSRARSARKVTPDQPWRNYSLYREEWRAKKGFVETMCPIERMMQAAAPRKSRFAA